nr:hypothetical protein [Oryza sativa Japonica Group]BAD10172.1 hypothetical protein [Oryza sativa Japonica Group]
MVSGDGSGSESEAAARSGDHRWIHRLPLTHHARLHPVALLLGREGSVRVLAFLAETKAARTHELSSPDLSGSA